MISPLQFRLAALQTLAAVQKVGKEGSKRTFTAKTTNVRLGEQATNRHSDLMHKSGPLSGPLLIKQQGVSIYNCIDNLYRRRPLLGTTKSPKAL